MSDYINPFNDFVFKYIFGRKETSDCLLSLINAILADSDMGKIQTIEILNPFNLKEFNEDKYSVLDIRAENENGDIYNIEVQLSGNEEFKYRSLYYWARLYSNQLKESEIYANLKPVICINILQFDLIKELDSFHTCFLPYEYKNKDILLTEHFQLHFLELPKFKKNESKITDKLQIWFNYLLLEGKGKEESMKGILDKNDDIKKAHKEFKKFTADDKMRELYEARLKKKRDDASLLKHAKLEGKIEGEIEGENKKAIKIAKSMLQDGEPIEKIVKHTGLLIEDIEKLK
jgi:predicted transposase/invertase (TIGR01784 family)